MVAKVGNMCEVVMRFRNVFADESGAVASYECCRNGHSLRRCSYFEPMRCLDGTLTFGECQHYDFGCTCAKARSAAMRRAKSVWARTRL